jgi:formate/nitrite transporter FocA (FNT family)
MSNIIRINLSQDRQIAVNHGTQEIKMSYGNMHANLLVSNGWPHNANIHTRTQNDTAKMSEFVNMHRNCNYVISLLCVVIITAELLDKHNQHNFLAKRLIITFFSHF